MTPAARASAAIEILADTEARAQAQEAEANAAQIAARLGLGDGAALQIEGVPEVANAKAANDLAQSEFDRARMNLPRRFRAGAERFDLAASALARERLRHLAAARILDADEQNTFHAIKIAWP